MLKFTGERIVPGSDTCEPRFADKMYHEHFVRYAFASQLIDGKTVLDIGCGVGYGSKWLAENGAKSVLAFDICPETILHAKEYYSHPKVRYEVASAENFNFGNSFDVVTCFELIEHVKYPAEVIRCAKKSINESGVLVISTPRALEIKRTEFHETEFSEAQFVDLIHTGFATVKLYFENNHFTSLITDCAPGFLNKVFPMFDQFKSEDADYFVALATNSTDCANLLVSEPTIAIGNDAYVKLLEHDVAILHQAENRLLDKLRIFEANSTSINNTLAQDISGRMLGSLVDIFDLMKTTLNYKNNIIKEQNSMIDCLNDSVLRAEAQIELLKDVFLDPDMDDYL